MARWDRALTWMVPVLAVVLFYLLSVPVAYGVYFRGAHRTLQISPWTPRWMRTYMEPYFWLAGNTPLQKQLHHYFIWCQQRAKDIATEILD